ncbi:MAG: hypothetical protein EBU90_19680 [Proteobacteria bacterium]|nr:hypothetical protein [Pseudomonadota bacterium]
MAGKTDTSATLFAQKKLLGKAHTSNLKIDGEEVIGSNIQTSTGIIFGEPIPNSPSQTLYLVQSASAGDNGTVEYIQFVLTALTGTTYDANVSGGGSGTDTGEDLQSAGPHAYKFVLPSNYQSISNNSRVGNGVFNNNKLVHESLGQLQLVPPFYSQTAPNPYIVKIYKDDGSGGVGDEIPLLDNVDWNVDYYNGILFLQDYSATKIPAFARAFAYVGKMAAEVISSGSSGVSNSNARGGDSDSQYLVLSATGSLSSERVFTVGTGLSATNGGPGSNYTVSIDDSVVATISGSTFTGVTKHVAGLSGSLTKLTDGTSYLIAGSGIRITTGSNGSITVESTVTGSSNTSESQIYSKGYFYGTSQDASGNIDVSSIGRLISGYNPQSDVDVYINGQLLVAGNDKDYTVPENTVIHFNTALNAEDIITVRLLTTGSSGAGSSGVAGATTFSESVKFNQGLSGSLTQLSDGTSYLKAGNNITVTTGSNGSITIGTNSASGFVNAGSDVTLGNLKARMSTSGNRSLQLSTVSGTYSVYGSGVYSYNGTGGATISQASPVSITTTPTYIQAGHNFETSGATDTWLLMDTSNLIAWKITLIVGASYNNNFISIEKLS